MPTSVTGAEFSHVLPLSVAPENKLKPMLHVFVQLVFFHTNIIADSLIFLPSFLCHPTSGEVTVKGRFVACFSRAWRRLTWPCPTTLPYPPVTKETSAFRLTCRDIRDLPPPFVMPFLFLISSPFSLTEFPTAFIIAAYSGIRHRPSSPISLLCLVFSLEGREVKRVGLLSYLLCCLLPSPELWLQIHSQTFLLRPGYTTSLS